MVGNIFLLDLPYKEAVIVHRRYTAQELVTLRNRWLQCGEQGGVLISAAIHPLEREIMREAMNRRYRLILLKSNGFPSLYKPSGEAFDACAQGRLLMISPFEHSTQHTVITREQCLLLNQMAETIVSPPSLPL